MEKQKGYAFIETCSASRWPKYLKVQMAQDGLHLSLGDPRQIGFRLAPTLLSQSCIASARLEFPWFRGHPSTELEWCSDATYEAVPGGSLGAYRQTASSWAQYGTLRPVV
eukprot:TRINITY_DN38611_c0_g1_i1.p3 TRINITY_DN38611_c0_g1~~TRINITY_DN38611_c0_g1_i1.p3  ORF type:complete len:110 (+),score=20.24 TRINITY_DN38611_c0_g1_i1:144-473(+)